MVKYSSSRDFLRLLRFISGQHSVREIHLCVLFH